MSFTVRLCALYQLSGRIGVRCGLPLALLAFGAAGGCGGAAEPTPYDSTVAELSAGRNLTAEFTDCVEFGGVGVVPLANIAGLVPAQFNAAIGPPGLAIAVAHIAKCENIRVGSGAGHPGIFGHFGVAVAPPAGSANHDNYLFAHVTDHVGLFLGLKLAGLESTYLNPRLSFETTGSGATSTLAAAVQRPAELAWTLAGPLPLPDPAQAPATNSINYWTRTDRIGNAALEYDIKGLRQAPAPGVVLTAQGTELQAIIGGTELTFPFFAAGESFTTTTLTFKRHVF